MSSGSGKRKASCLVGVRFTPEAFAQVSQAAQRAGYDRLGEYLRVQAMGPGQGRGARLPQIDRAELVRTLAELGKIGSNVNQLARAVNASGGDELPHAATLRDVQADLADAFQAVRKALGRR